MSDDCQHNLSEVAIGAHHGECEFINTNSYLTAPLL